MGGGGGSNGGGFTDATARASHPLVLTHFFAYAYALPFPSPPSPPPSSFLSWGSLQSSSGGLRTHFLFLCVARDLRSLSLSHTHTHTNPGRKKGVCVCGRGEREREKKKAKQLLQPPSPSNPGGGDFAVSVVTFSCVHGVASLSPRRPKCTGGGEKLGFFFSSSSSFDNFDLLWPKIRPFKGREGGGGRKGGQFAFSC